MDADRFDAIAKELFVARSRRRLAQAAAGAAVAALVGAVRPQGAAACKGFGQDCRGTGQAQCCPELMCLNRRCRCDPAGNFCGEGKHC
jgi:hypothetical protein